MPYSFQRIRDNGYDSLNITEWAVSDKNNIIAFTANGVHFHLKKHQEPFHFFKDAKSAATTGGGAGAYYGKPGGPKRMLKGATVGSIIYFAGELAYEKIMEHYGKLRDGQNIRLCYVDDRGNEVYWGPVSA